MLPYRFCYLNEIPIRHIPHLARAAGTLQGLRILVLERERRSAILQVTNGAH